MVVIVNHDSRKTRHDFLEFNIDFRHKVLPRDAFPIRDLDCCSLNTGLWPCDCRISRSGDP